MKTILITGATSGIGLAAAKKLANEKNQLILCGRRQRKLDEISEELSKSANVLTLCFDVSKNSNKIDRLRACWQAQNLPRCRKSSKVIENSRESFGFPSKMTKVLTKS